MAIHPTFWSGRSVSSACCSRGRPSPSSEVVLSSILAQTPGPGMASLRLLGRRAENTRHVGIILLQALKVGTTQKGFLSAERMPIGEIKAWKCCVAKWSKHSREEPSGTLPGLAPQRKAQTCGININWRPQEQDGFPSSPSGNPDTQYLIAFWALNHPSLRSNTLVMNPPLSG